MKKDVTKPDKKIVIPLGVSAELKRAIEQATKEADGLSEQAVIRLSLKKGLPLLKKALQPA